jgi:hypothetical protein
MDEPALSAGNDRAAAGAPGSDDKLATVPGEASGVELI